MFGEVSEMEKIRIALCDDVEYFSENFRTYASYETDFLFVGYSQYAHSCIAMLEECKPDILLLDIKMEMETSGIDLIPEVKAKFPDMKIAMITSYTEEELIFKSLVNGADDYIVKESSLKEIFDKIKSICNGSNFIASEILSKFKNYGRLVVKNQNSLLYIISIIGTLSKGEFEVLKDLYSGETYRSIAKKRFVEEGTIRTLGSRIIKKFGETSMKTLLKNLRELKVFDNIEDK